jgi:hypothetical protein
MTDVFSRLGAHNIARILTALTTSDTHQPVKEVVSSDKQKWYIIKNIENLNRDSKIVIGNLILMNNMAKELKSNGNDLIINLDNLSDNIIEQIYIFINYKTGA